LSLLQSPAMYFENPQVAQTSSKSSPYAPIG
jgi:hypothetical protein